MRGSTTFHHLSKPLAEGVSRREFAKLAALIAAGSVMPFGNEFTLAQDIKAIAAIPSDAVRLNANENPMGPCQAALEAVARMVPQGGRYHFDQTHGFVEAMAAEVGLPETHISPSAGSSDALHRSVLAYTSPTRPLVTADPGYEAPEKPAAFMGAKIIKVPLRKDFSHDVQAMARASMETGVLYVCNPNNPTGTVTRKADLDYLVANKPKDCMVVIDEAYLHFSSSATSAVDHVEAGRDVIVLRTFSKLYGLAGLRAGAALARPDILERLRGFGGLPIMPCTGMAAAMASLKDKNLVPTRKKMLAGIREDLFAWLGKKGYGYIPSEANMVMIDCKRPGKEIAEAMLAQKVAIGRAWPSWPHHVRVTIGTSEEMTKFKAAFERVMSA